MIDTTRKNIIRARSEHPRSCTDSQVHPSSATGRVIHSVRPVHTAHCARREPALLTTASGGHISGEGRAEPEMEISLAAGITTRAAGHSEHGPAHVQAAHAQHAQAGSDARAARGAPVK